MPETVEDQISYYSQKAGDLSRQLGLAGIGVIWLFKISSEQGNLAIQSPLLPAKLYFPLVLIIASLALDSIQYLIGIIGWGRLWWKNKGSEEAGKKHKCLVSTLIIIVGIKVAIMLFAYVMLLLALKGIIHFT